MVADERGPDAAPPAYPRLRVHQARALEAVERAEVGGSRRAWVVLPPGAGKTLVGLETARRRDRTTVVLGPNTAIVGQWLRGWDAYGASPASPTRDLEAPFTALTYQSLAVFEDHDTVDDDEVAGEGLGEGGLLDALHPNGRALVERLKGVGDLTLVLDECHHLVEVWGRLLAELLAELPDAFVLGLTATPPSTLTLAQHELVDELFGEPLCTVSIPAVVREGDLAPFAELAWLTTPTPTEADWLAEQGTRFAELTAALSDPSYGSTSFFAWLDQRFLAGLPGEPAELDAALRMVHAGLLDLPAGATLREQHRRAPDADDWVLLIAGWLELLDRGGADEEVVRRLRQVLPSVGYQLTRRGIRRGRTPVDRVLARSEAKTVALTHIVRAEHSNLGDRLRMLVLCDHERASATLPVDLTGVVDEQAGSATLALEHLRRAVTGLHPLMVTGSTVAGDDETLERLRSYVGAPGLAVVDGRLEGGWTSREWVPWVTRFFEDGHCQVLVGTRGLLGEGWDARTVTGLVDLTSATTSTAVVQTRGRALRNDPGWPEKVALTWTVVCVSEDHPKGGNDWQRFVRKHDGFYGVDADGDVVSGVAHVDAAFSPYAPPPVADFGEVNARMLVRSERRDLVRDAWAVGTAYDDTVVHTVRITGDRAQPGDEPAAVVLHGRVVVVRDSRPSPWRPHPVIAVGGVMAVVAFLLNLTPAMVIGLGLATMIGLQVTVAIDRGRVVAEGLTRPPGIAQVARAVADALHETGLTPVGAEAVTTSLDELGEYRCALDGVPPAASAAFAAALEEVVSPIASPRYVVPRWVMLDEVDNADGLRVAFGRLRPDGEVWHSVPTMLGTTGARAQAFARAWDHWVGGGAALYTGSPQGQGVLVTQRGADPFAVTTVMRTQWR